MGNKDYQTQLKLHAESIELAIKGCDIEIEYHKKQLQVAEHHKCNLIESLAVAKQQIELAKQ